MLEALNNNFPEAETLCADFEEEAILGDNFDFILIFNSIPHFKDLDKVFMNAVRNLKDGGKFIIAHARTRQGLKDHHKRIGFESTREPIPNDQKLTSLATKYQMNNIQLQDDEFFCFSCQTNKKQPAHKQGTSCQ